MNFIKTAIAFAALSVAVGASFAAADAPAGQTTPAAPAATSADVALTRGVVKKIDAEQGKITIQHEALANLDMPAMTMVFRAADAKVLEGVQVGQGVAFRAERLNGAFVVTRLQPQS
jgi:Cu(I)/Ag(I) efflux system protein CusF